MPKRAIDEAAMLKVDLGTTVSNYRFGDLDLSISLISLKDGRSISKLNQPMQIRPWFDARIPRLIEVDECSYQFTLLRTAYLPTVRPAGYFVNKSGLLTLFTRQLSEVTNLELRNGEKICLATQSAFTFAPRDFNRVVASKLEDFSYLMIDLKEKFAGREIELSLRRSFNKESRITKIATLRVNANGDAIYPYDEEILKSDRFRVRIGKLPLAIKTVALIKP